MIIHDYPVISLLLALASLWLLRWSLRRPSASRARHRRYVAKARRVYQTVSAFRGAHRTGQVISYLRKINPYVFEEVVLEAFARKGYRIERNRSYSGDGGVDGRLYDQQGRLILIQAKRYQGHVKLAHLQEFEQVALARKARGYFVHTGKTTKRWGGTASCVTVVSGSSLGDLFYDQKPTR